MPDAAPGARGLDTMRTGNAATPIAWAGDDEDTGGQAWIGRNRHGR